MTMTGWWERAACKGMDLELFFPGKGERSDDAKRACALCPVREDCHADAATHRTFGVWGGVTWNDGQPRYQEDAVLASYPAETRAAAVALYRRLRTRYRNEKTTLDAVVRQLDLRDPSAVRKWVAAEVPHPERQPDSQRSTPAQRAAALAMLHRVRRQHPTAKAAVEAVAREFGVHADTLRKWEKQAQASAARQIGAAA